MVTTYQRHPKSAEYTREQANNMGIRMMIAPRADEALTLAIPSRRIVNFIMR